jgi:hypothetical protein
VIAATPHDLALAYQQGAVEFARVGNIVAIWMHSRFAGIALVATQQVVWKSGGPGAAPVVMSWCGWVAGERAAPARRAA